MLTFRLNSDLFYKIYYDRVNVLLHTLNPNFKGVQSKYDGPVRSEIGCLAVGDIYQRM